MENVEKFLSECSKAVGKHEEDVFEGSTLSEFSDCNIESPIEQLLYVAMKAIKKINFIADHMVVDHSNGRECFHVGLCILPQYKINKFKCDFLIIFGSPVSAIPHNWKQRILNEVIIECDGHDWHDRNEKQRRYEKQRDRYLQSEGYKISHYTGKEIFENPVKVAVEILNTVTERELEFLQYS